MHLPIQLVVQLRSTAKRTATLSDIVITLHVLQGHRIRHLFVLGRTDARGRLVVSGPELEQRLAAESSVQAADLRVILGSRDPRVECALVGGRSFGRILPMLQSLERSGGSPHFLTGVRNAHFETEIRLCPWSADTIEVEIPAVPLGGLTASTYKQHQESLRSALALCALMSGLLLFGGPAQVRYASVIIWPGVLWLLYLLWWQLRHREEIAVLHRASRKAPELGRRSARFVVVLGSTLRTRPRIRAALLALGTLARLAAGAKSLWPRVVHAIAFQPRRLTREAAAPARWRLPHAEVVEFSAPGGPRLYGWWVPAATQPDHRACGTVVLYHGNAGDITSRGWQADRLATAGYDVLLFDYRGYGASAGRPTEAGMRADAIAAYDLVRTRRHVPAERIVLLGHSMGSVLATQVAAERPVAGLVLEAPFATAADVATHWLPGGWPGLGGLEFDAASAMRRVRAPVLMATGGRDRLIPRASAATLYTATAEPKQWVDVPEAGHNDIFSSPKFWRALHRFLPRVLACEAVPAENGTVSRPLP